MNQNCVNVQPFGFMIVTVFIIPTISITLRLYVMKPVADQTRWITLWSHPHNALSLKSGWLLGHLVITKGERGGRKEVKRRARHKARDR